jgi:hypothetical protein
VPCHEARRFEDLSSTDMRPHRVCPQQRLYSVWAYCDDPIFIVVVAERTLRALPLTSCLLDCTTLYALTDIRSRYQYGLA